MHCYRIFRINYPNLTSTLNISDRTDILVATPVSERDRDQRQDPYRQLMYTVRGRLYSSWWFALGITPSLSIHDCTTTHMGLFWNSLLWEFCCKWGEGCRWWDSVWCHNTECWKEERNTSTFSTQQLWTLIQHYWSFWGLITSNLILTGLHVGICLARCCIKNMK